MSIDTSKFSRTRKVNNEGEFHTRIQGRESDKRTIFTIIKGLQNTYFIQQHHWLHRTWCTDHLNILLNLLGNALLHPNKLDQSCDHRGLGLMRESRLDSGRPVAKIVKIGCKAHLFTILARSPNSSSRCVSGAMPGFHRQIDPDHQPCASRPLYRATSQFPCGRCHCVPRHFGARSIKRELRKHTASHS